jgi:multidrug resistance efflux pump
MTTSTTQENRSAENHNAAGVATNGSVPPNGNSPAPRRRARLRSVRSIIVVIALLAAVAVGGAYVIRERLAAGTFVSLGAAVLTVPAVPVGSASAAVVTNILVTEGSQVTAGQELARVTQSVRGPDGKPETDILHAPTDGTVASINIPVGGVASPAQPIVMLYEKAKLAFHCEASVKQLQKLRIGMTAYIIGPGLSRRIPATLDHVVPRIGKDALTTEGKIAPDAKIAVMLVPRASELSTVSTLVPGLEFEASVDTKTATDGASAINGAR